MIYRQLSREDTHTSQFERLIGLYRCLQGNSRLKSVSPGIEHRAGTSAVSHFSLTLPLHLHYLTSFIQVDVSKNAVQVQIQSICVEDSAVYTPEALVVTSGATCKKKNRPLGRDTQYHLLHYRDDYILALGHEINLFCRLSAGACGLRLSPDSVISWQYYLALNIKPVTTMRPRSSNINCALIEVRYGRIKH